MSIPNHSAALYKKLLAASLESGPTVTMSQTTAGACDYQNPSLSCTANGVFTIANPDVATITNIVWTTTIGSVTAGQGTLVATVSDTASTNDSGTVTATMTVNGEPLVLNAATTYSHTDTSTPISIVSIDLDSGGSCEYPAAGNCVAQSVYSLTTANGNGTKTYVWSVDGGASVVGSNTGATVTVDGPNGAVNVSYNVSCTVTDNTGNDSDTQQFTDTKTEEATDVARSAYVYKTGTGSTTTTYDVPAGNDRLVGCVILATAASGSTLTALNVTLGGQAATKATTSTGNWTANFYYWKESQIAAMSGNSLVYVSSGSSAQLNRISMWLSTIENVSQTTPLGQISTSNSKSLALTALPNPRAIISGMMSSYSATGVYSWTGTTEKFDGAVSASGRIASGTWSETTPLTTYNTPETYIEGTDTLTVAVTTGSNPVNDKFLVVVNNNSIV